MPQTGDGKRNGQPIWPAYAVTIIIVGAAFTLLNIPFTVAIIQAVVSHSSIVYTVFWLAVFGAPTIFLDILLARWLKDNLQVFHWTNQSLREGEKGDRPC